MEEIRNRVAESKLVTFDLEDHYPKGERVQLDISQWLYEGLLLREKEFRQSLKEVNWQSYQDAFVALHCSTDAIVPAWAYMLIATYLTPYAQKTVVGDPDHLETVIYQEVINDLDLEYLRDLPVIVKGCSNKPVPQNAYLFLLRKLQPIAKTIMYGEACSSVPLYKRK
ncbi:DUF2480 family protein [Robertkochia marina]|uniref:DUF2480 family protein n=1 Tax=Robertkochia marina TaxID=1227945 RepID=A0A4S3M2P7_9FLAO|nr:DUF2480 family protein [Robertkochia marina]THD69404.1 DUF2480 family protein [Robertkochia marina]TRZ47335.1 DUF2480 family protein [Robertkochia marina]